MFGKTQWVGYNDLTEREDKNMNTFAERMTEAMNKYGVTINELSRRTGLNKGSLSHYKNGSYEPKQTNIFLLSQALNVSPGWLMGFDLPERSYLLDEEILRLWRQLDFEQQKAVAQYIQSLIADRTEEP